MKWLIFDKERHDFTWNHENEETEKIRTLVSEVSFFVTWLTQHRGIHKMEKKLYF